jgi:hypothetical protein
MATAAVIESPTIPAMPMDAWNQAPSADIESSPLRGPTARSGNNLAAAILWLAVEDYQHGNPENRQSARKFLYPEIPGAREHLAGVCGMMNDLSFQALREALDRMRPHWDAKRKREEKS